MFTGLAVCKIEEEKDYRQSKLMLGVDGRLPLSGGAEPSPQDPRAEPAGEDHVHRVPRQSLHLPALWAGEERALRGRAVHLRAQPGGRVPAEGVHQCHQQLHVSGWPLHSSFFFWGGGGGELMLERGC